MRHSRFSRRGGRRISRRPGHRISRVFVHRGGYRL